MRLAKHRGKYVAVDYSSGERKRISLGTDNRNTARARLADLELAARMAQRPATVTVEYVYQQYLEAKPNYRAEYAFKRMASTFGALAPEQITEIKCRAYAKDRRAKDGTIHTELGYLRTALKWGEDHGLIVKAPEIWRPEKPRPRARYLTRDEATKLLDAAQMPHMKLFIVLALTTAGRMGAILSLTWDRVDFDRGIIQLDDPERDRTRKGRATVPMNETSRRALLEAHKGAMSGYVIEWGGERVGSVKKGVREAARRAGLDGVSAHVLRHTAAVWMAEAGVPMSEIAQYLGHSNPRITFKVYARYSPDYLRKAASALELHSDTWHDVPVGHER